MSLGIIGSILGIYALILWIVVFFAWRKGYKEWKANRANRVHKLHAKVLDRRENVVPVSPQTEPTMEYMVLFEFDGRQKEFKTDSKVYDMARVGQEGILYLRGGQFENFEPKSESEKADEVYGRMVKGK